MAVRLNYHRSEMGKANGVYETGGKLGELKTAERENKRRNQRETQRIGGRVGWVGGWVEGG